MSRGSSFWINSLYLLSAFLLITSLLLPYSGVECGLSFIDNNKYLSAGIGLLCLIAAAVPLFIISSFAAKSAISSNISVVLFFILSLVSSGSIYFSYTHLSLIAFAWGQFFILKEDNFKALFFSSIAALLVPELMWIIPVMVGVSAAGKGDLPRAILVNLSGVVLPVLYVFLYRHILYKDALEYLYIYWNSMINVSSPVLSLSFTNIFLVVIVGFMILHSCLSIVSRHSQTNIATENVLRAEVISALLLCVIYILFWGNDSSSLNLLLAFPVSLILSNLLTVKKYSAAFKIELIVFICAVILYRLHFFI